MPTALLYDCFSGISGDMHIGAMLDLGVPESMLRAQLSKLSMAGEFSLEVAPGSRMGITGTQATVRLAPDAARPHRHLANIVQIIDKAQFAAPIRRRAVGMFESLARAEAKIHGTTMDAIHFHEVGATDSIVDIVSAAVCLEHLDAQVVGCTPLELGGGMVRCEHGLMPVPAPATAELLTGIPCRYGGVNQEATTPTGAVIVKEAITQIDAPQGFTTERVGYGIGQKEFDIPNVLRVCLGHVAERQDYDVETNHQVECNIDDMSPEAFAPLLDTLFAHGARDVFMTPIVMKKSRPGTKLTLLCGQDALDELLALVFEHSTTIGVRVTQVEKRMLPRELSTVQTSLGPVQVKTVTLPGGSQRWKPEHDDVQDAAARNGLSYLDAAARIQREIDPQAKSE